AFKSGKEHRLQKELKEAHKAGLAPAEVDEDGKEINPHIPASMSFSHWYLNAQRPSLMHQKNWKLDSSNTNSSYDRAKDCVERPQKVRAEWTGENIAPDEKIETIVFNYDGKRDRWNGYDAASYADVIYRYEARNEARK
nr:pre-mRNA-splicing factor SLU7-like [Tanacetum cinerariifolium]